MANFSKHLYFISFFLFFSSCISFSEPEVIDFKIIDVNRDSLNNLILKTSVDIYNPNFFTISSNELKINVFYDTILVANSFFENQIDILKKDTFNLNTDFAIKTNSIKYFTNAKDSIHLKVNGYTRMPLLNKKYFFNTTLTFFPESEIAEISNFFIKKIGLKISEIKFINANFNEINLNIGLTFNSLNQFNFSINQLETFIYSDKNKTKLLGVSKLDIKELNSLDDSKIIYSNVKLNSINFTKLLFLNSLNQNNILYVRVNSEVDFNGVNFPISLNKEIHYNPLTFEVELR